MPREEVDIHDGIIIGLPAAQFDRDALLEAVVYRLVVGARPSEIVALDFLAADLAQELELLLRLDALRERPPMRLSIEMIEMMMSRARCVSLLRNAISIFRRSKR